MLNSFAKFPPQCTGPVKATCASFTGALPVMMKEPTTTLLSMVLPAIPCLKNHGEAATKVWKNVAKSWSVRLLTTSIVSRNARNHHQSASHFQSRFDLSRKKDVGRRQMEMNLILARKEENDERWQKCKDGDAFIIDAMGNRSGFLLSF